VTDPAVVQSALTAADHSFVALCTFGAALAHFIGARVANRRTVLWLSQRVRRLEVHLFGDLPPPAAASSEES
jgi:hypothetical protein